MPAQESTARTLRVFQDWDLYATPSTDDLLEDVSRSQEENPFEPARKEVGTRYDVYSLGGTQDFLIERIQRLPNSVDAGNKQQQQAHSKILEHYQRTEALLERTQEENEHLRVLLSKTYPVERMQAVSSAVAFACAVSLVASLSLQVDVLHPSLALIGLLASSTFMALAHWRKKHGC